MNIKLSDADIRYIMAVYKPYDRCYGTYALAKYFNVQPETIAQAIKRASQTKAKNLEKYIDRKIAMIQEEFCIKLTENELIHFRACKSEFEVDHYARDILKR